MGVIFMIERCGQALWGEGSNGDVSKKPVAIKCKPGFFTCSCGDNGDVMRRLKPAPPCSFTAKR